MQQQQHRRTESEVARVEHDIHELDEEIRQLELLAQQESQYQRGDIPMPEFGGGGYGMPAFGPSYGGGGGVYRPIVSPLAGPYVLGAGMGWQGVPMAGGYMGQAYAMPPAYVQSGAYGYPVMSVTPPMVPSPHAPQVAHRHHHHYQQSSMSSGPSESTQMVQTRERSGTQSLEELQAMAARKQAQERADLGAALKSSIIFTLTMLGEAAFFMVRDWLDTTKHRKRNTSTSAVSAVDDSVAMAALEELERASASDSSNALSIKQRMRQVKSVKQLIRASNVNEVIGGLRDSGRGDEAESLARRLLAIRRQMYGNEHPATAQALNQLGAVLASLEAYEEAAATFAEALQVVRTAYRYSSKGSVPPLLEARLLHSLASMKAVLAHEGSLELKREAEDIANELVALCEAKFGPEDPKTIQYKRVWVSGFKKSYVPPDAKRGTALGNKSAAPLPVEEVIQAAAKVE